MKKESVLDVALLIAPIIGGAVLTAVVGQWYWFAFLVAFGLALGIVELVAKLSSGKTLTQQFAAWKKASKWQAVLFLAILWAFFIYLTVHLWF